MSWKTTHCEIISTSLLPIIMPSDKKFCVPGCFESGGAMNSVKQTAVSDHSKNRNAVSDHSKNQLVVRNYSKNRTTVSDSSKNRAVVNIKVEDAVDDSHYSAGVDSLAVDDDDCYNISDDDCLVDDDSSFYHNVSKLPDDKDYMEPPQKLEKNDDLHDGFKCNFCSGEIRGYRYTCVQCPDYDLCGSCEARGAHCLHYVLRIPRPKPYSEMQPLLREIRRLLSGEDTDMLWTHPDEIKEEESNDDVDPLYIVCVTPTLSETEDNVPEITTRTSVKKSQGNRQDKNDTAPEVTKLPRLKSHLHKATTYTRHKHTVTDDKRSAASTSSPYTASTRLMASTLLTSPQAIDNTGTPASNSSQYTASTKLEPPDGNNVLTIGYKPKVIDKTRTPVSVSSPYPALARIASKRNTLTIESSPQAIDNTRTPVSASSPKPALARLASKRNTLTIESSTQAIDKTRTPASESTSVSSNGNTVLTIATNVEDPDSASRSVPTTSRLYASSSITPGNTETISNKTTITGDSRLQAPMATKRKCSDNIEASKHKVVLLKGSKKLIPTMSEVFGPGKKFKIIKKPSATGQPQAQGAVSLAGNQTQSTQRGQDAAR